MERFSNILFVVNRRRWFREAYERALTLAARESARLTVLDIIEEAPRLPVNHSSKDRKVISTVGRRTNKKLVTARRKVLVQLNVVGGNWLKEIIGEVRRGRHNLVILAAAAKERLPRMIVQLVRKWPLFHLDHKVRRTSTI